jgi:hypothetical protein
MGLIQTPCLRLVMRRSGVRFRARGTRDLSHQLYDQILSLPRLSKAELARQAVMPGLRGAAERRRLATDRSQLLMFAPTIRYYRLLCDALLRRSRHVGAEYMPHGGGASAERHVLAAFCLPVLALVRIGTVWDAGSAVAGSG